jgi:hypothetical protein
VTTTLLRPDDLAADEAPYPPAPWTLRGDAVVVPIPVRTMNVRRFVPYEVDLVSVNGWTMGGILLADYKDGATLDYHELIVFAGLARAGGKAGMWVSHIVVDSPASVAGGRRIWGLPKGPATFAYGARRVDVHGLLSARIRERRVRVPLPLTPATFGVRDESLVWTASKGTLRGGPALVRVEVPADSPLAPLGLGGTWPALAGDRLDLPFPEPLPLP